jgi:hypothetical protein
MKDQLAAYQAFVRPFCEVRDLAYNFRPGERVLVHGDGNGLGLAPHQHVPFIFKVQ